MISASQESGHTPGTILRSPGSPVYRLAAKIPSNIPTEGMPFIFISAVQEFTMELIVTMILLTVFIHISFVRVFFELISQIQ